MVATLRVVELYWMSALTNASGESAYATRDPNSVCVNDPCCTVTSFQVKVGSNVKRDEMLIRPVAMLNAFRCPL